jgi:phosphoserine phosphatase
MRKKSKIITLDMDSTLVSVETMDTCFNRILDKRVNEKIITTKEKFQIIELFEKNTEFAMNGITSYSESFALRLAFLVGLKITEQELKDEILEILSEEKLAKDKFFDSLKNLISNIKSLGFEVKILTSGTHTFADHVAESFDLTKHDVLANNLVFDNSGNTIGYKIYKDRAKSLRERVNHFLTDRLEEYFVDDMQSTKQMSKLIGIPQLFETNDEEGFLSDDTGKPDVFSAEIDKHDLAIHIGDGSNDAQILDLNKDHMNFVLAEWYVKRDILKNNLIRDGKNFLVAEKTDDLLDIIQKIEKNLL